MAKKLSLLFAAAAVLAFAVPAFASAATQLTEAGGVVVPVGSKITGTNVGSPVTKNSKTTITCKKVMVEAELVTNSGGTVKAEGTKNSNAEECTNNSGTAAKVSSIELKELHSTGGGTGTANVAYTIELSPGGLVCTFSTPTGAGTYNPTETADGGHIISISNQAVTASPLACGSGWTLTASFTMETAGTTTPVYLM